MPRVARCVDGFGRMMHRNCDTLRRPQRKPSYTAGRVLNSNGLPANAETPFHQSHHPFRPTRLPPFPLRPHVCRFEKAVARSLYQTQTEQNTHTHTETQPGSYLDLTWILPRLHMFPSRTNSDFRGRPEIWKRFQKSGNPTLWVSRLARASRSRFW